LKIADNSQKAIDVAVWDDVATSFKGEKADIFIARNVRAAAILKWFSELSSSGSVEVYSVSEYAPVTYNESASKAVSCG
jgi:hypothetical protein